MAASDTARAPAPTTRKPYDDEIDVSAVTHPGHVRFGSGGKLIPI
ncbi:MAG: hypothetical protein ACAI18_16830 [Gemmatimonadales bacterium]|jgi:hypothetical protein